MENGILTNGKDEALVRKLVESVVSTRGYQEIKANVDGYDTPAKLRRPNAEGAYIPDATGLLNGKKKLLRISSKE